MVIQTETAHLSQHEHLLLQLGGLHVLPGRHDEHLGDERLGVSGN